MADDIIEIDLDEFTLEEVRDMEVAAGVAFQTMNPQALPTSVLIAAVWIIKRRDDPTFTLEDAGKVKLRLLGSPGNGNGGPVRRTTRSSPVKRK